MRELETDTVRRTGAEEDEYEDEFQHGEVEYNQPEDDYGAEDAEELVNES